MEPSQSTGDPAYVGLGANLGRRYDCLSGAVEALQNHPRITLVRRSRVYETSPVGGPSGQGDYLNACVSLTTTLRPAQLLGVLQDIERAAGRVRRVRWEARELDLDLLMFGSTVMVSEGLTLPHPRMHQRLFVLMPLADIAVDVIHPTTGKTIGQLLKECKTAGGVEQAHAVGI